MPPATRNGKHSSGRIVAEYTYTDESGEPLFQTVRFEPKDFRQRHRGPDGKWAWNLDGVRRVLYRLPEIIAQPPLTPVVVVEGEKDADRLWEIGQPATTSPLGAGKWDAAFAESLRGRLVAILPDNDDAGRKHARDVYQSLAGVAADVKIAELPGLPEKGDVSDWIDAQPAGADLCRRLWDAINGTFSEPAEPTEAPRRSAEEGKGRPGDDYNRDGPDWSAILGPHGWVEVGRGSGKRCWRRPGKGPREGHSATTGHCSGDDGADLLYVFSGNAHPFEEGKSYSKFRAFAVLNHGGDLSRAAHDLGQQGFGDQRTAAGKFTFGDRRNGQAEPPNAEPAPWPDLLPLDAAPEVEPPPLDVLPEQLAQLVREIAYATNTPTDFGLLDVLVLAGGAAANSCHLSITSTHRQAPSLNGACVALPGAGKTTPLKILRKPFDDIQSCFLTTYKREYEVWKDGDPVTRGPKPVLTRCIVSDITVETHKAVLAENPRGLVMVRNELSALVAGLNQYKGGRGNDRQFYLCLADGDPIIDDRKSDKSRDGAPLFIRDGFTAVIGTLQPAVLEAFRGTGAVNDGWIDRWLFVWPDELPAVGERWADVSEHLLAAWTKIVDRLLSHRQVAAESGGLRPYYIPFDATGRREWELFTTAHAAEVNAVDFPKCLDGPWAKLRGFCSRLALIVHLIREAAGETDLKAVDGESVARAARLVGYFKSHTRKVYALMGGDPHADGARRLADWIAEQRCSEFSRRDAQQAPANRRTFAKAEDIDPALELLKKHHVIRPKSPDAKTGRGHASPVFEVNPAFGKGGAE